MTSIEYKKGKGKYKYTLLKEYKFQLPFYFPECLTEFVKLEKEFLYIAEDYAWDGATCAIDTHDFMRGSLIHDVMYQLIREGKISKKHRIDADRLLKDICLADGMPKWRASYVYYSVRAIGWRFV
jgi:hypothetical protein